MTRAVGVGSIAFGAAIALGALVRWSRLPAWGAVTPMALAGLLLGAGALLVQDHPGPGDWMIALPALGVFTPLHFRVLMGPPGTRRALGRS